MKQLATIGAVVVLLLAAALYFSTKNNGDTPNPVPPETPIATPTPDPNTPVMSAATKGTLSMTAAISNGYIKTGAMLDVFAAVDVNAIEYDGGKRPPINVAVVIDRSGSMAGQKIENAKNAARRLVNMLNENDRVAIVSYGSDVTVDFSSSLLAPAYRVQLLRAINQISVGGGTNLSGGFQQGYSEVSRNKTEETINRVVLMSDGHANVGMTNINDLARLSTGALTNSVSVSTLGVGLDYNENLMTRMANEGAGNYYFIDQPSAIAGIFEKELKGLAATVARNTAVVVKLAPGVELQKLFGFAHRVSGDQIFISMAEFHSGETKNILLKLKAGPHAEGKTPIMDISLSYNDVVNSKPDHAAISLSSVTTVDEKLAMTAVNVDVIARVQQVEVAETLNDAMDLYADGKAEEATRRIERTQKSMDQRRKQYKFKDDKAFGRAAQELDAVKGSVNSAPASSAAGKRLRKSKKARSNAILFDSAEF